MSDAPSTNNAAIDRVNFVDKPNTIVAIPKIATHANIASPACRCRTILPSINPSIAAPSAGALRSTPSPNGPTCRMSRALDREQRSRAAEQHCEQIQRERAEDQRLAPDVRDSRGNPLEHRRIGLSLVAHAAALDSDKHDRDSHEQDRAD